MAIQIPQHLLRELHVGLTAGQLQVSQLRGNRQKPVIEMAEGIAHHFEVHVQQVRDIRTKLGR